MANKDEKLSLEMGNETEKDEANKKTNTILSVRSKFTSFT